jgi:hypothetical protein
MAVLIPTLPPGAVLVTGDHVVTTERYLNVDASGGPATITVPAAADGTDHGIRKVDDSANTVTVNEDGGGQLFICSGQEEIHNAYSDGAAYDIL